MILGGAALWGVPKLTMILGLIDSGAQFIPFFITLAAFTMVFFDKLAYRVGVITVIFCGIFSIYQPIILSEIIDGLNFRMLDVFFNVRGPVKPTGQVIIVDVDDKSLTEMGQWPVPRTEIARLIRNMKADGVRVIGFDIVFAEPDRNSLKDWVFRVQQVGIELKFPGMTLEESRELIAMGMWDLTVSGDVLKEDVLTDWERRFTEEDPDFYADPSLSPEERELIVVQQFVEYDRQKWESAEELMMNRVRTVGGNYEIKTYTPPEDPLHMMATQSTDLYYVVPETSNPNWHQEEALVVIDNDYEMGLGFAEGRVVAGGFMRMPVSAGAKGERYRDDESLEESEGMVISAGISKTDEFFPHQRKAIGQVLNIPEIQQMAYHQGMFNIIPDPSGAARYYTMFMQAPVYQTTMVLHGLLL